jgi:hypothetical protein
MADQPKPGRVARPQSANADAPTELTRACVASASLRDRPLQAADFPQIRDAYQISQSRQPQDFANVVDWVLARRGHEDLAESWSKVVCCYYRIFSRPLLALPLFMLGAAGIAFVLTVLVDWMLGLRLVAQRSVSDVMPNYQIAWVLTGLAGRALFLCITTLLAVYGLVRALVPLPRRKPNDDELSVFDRMANRVVIAIGRLPSNEQDHLANNSAVADGARRLILRELRPTQVVCAWIMLLVGAFTIGINGGHFVAYRLVEGLVNESAPVWQANLKGNREWLLQRWLDVTGTNRMVFTGGCEEAQLMEWLRQSPKRPDKELAECDAVWRDSFSKLIGESNKLLTLLALLPLGLNLLTFLLTAARLKLPSGNLSRRLLAMPGGGNKTFFDVVEEIQNWIPEPPGPPRPVSRRSDSNQQAVRRITDEVWLVRVHTLTRSAALFDDANVAGLSSRLGRPVRVFDGRTHASKRMLMRPDNQGPLSDVQPTCILYVVHAPAPPTEDVLDFISDMELEYPDSVKAVTVADLPSESLRDRNARDELWRASLFGRNGSLDGRGIHQFITSSDIEHHGEELRRRLATAIARVVSPLSGTLSERGPEGVSHEDRDRRVRKAFEVIANALRQACRLDDRNFANRLEALRRRTDGSLRQVLSDDSWSLRESAAAALRFGDEQREAVVELATEAVDGSTSDASETIERLAMRARHTATGLFGLAIMTVFSGFIPITFGVMAMAAAAWGIYGLLTLARSQLQRRGATAGAVELPIGQKSRTLAEFVAMLVSSACVLHGGDDEECGQRCHTAAMAWKRGMSHDRLPEESDLLECWMACFPDHSSPR